MEPYNSIQDGACCRGCFVQTLTEARADGTLIAVSERFRTSAQMIVAQVTNHLEGMPPDPCLQDEYVDRVILQVTDGTDPQYPGTRELIIISASLKPEECSCQASV